MKLFFVGVSSLVADQFFELYEDHPLASEILETKTDKKREKLIRQALDLAKLSKGVLKGADLSAFIKRSVDLIK